MKSDKLLYGKYPSGCCNSRTIIVRSRPGGFVTQNCEKCGDPKSISDFEFPAAKCTKCKSDMRVVLVRKNYAYKCSQCGREEMIHELVPSWEERFEYHGYGIPGVDFEYWF